MTTQTQSWRMYEEERADIHDFLASLEPEQWDAPSLCEGWRVRDVAVHLLVDGPIEEIGAPRALVKAATFRFSVHRVNAWWVEHNHDRPTDSVVAAFGGPWRPGWVSRRLGPAIGMRATVIHIRTCAGRSGWRGRSPKSACGPRSTSSSLLVAVQTSVRSSAARAWVCGRQTWTGRGEKASRCPVQPNRS